MRWGADTSRRPWGSLFSGGGSARESEAVITWEGRVSVGGGRQLS